MREVLFNRVIHCVLLDLNKLTCLEDGSWYSMWPPHEGSDVSSWGGAVVPMYIPLKSPDVRQAKVAMQIRKSPEAMTLFVTK